MAWSYFSCGVSEKVSFQKMRFLKDGVQTVVLFSRQIQCSCEVFRMFS